MTTTTQNTIASSHLPTGLARVGRFIEFGAIAYGCLAVIGGFAIAGTSSTDSIGSTTHPYVALGVAAAFLAVMVALVAFGFGRICRIIAADHGAQDSYPAPSVTVSDGTY